LKGFGFVECRAKQKIVIASDANDLLSRDWEGQQIPRFARDDNLVVRAVLAALGR